MTNQSISTGQLWRYSVLAIPIAFAGFPLYVLAPDYYATTHGVSLSLLGFLLLGLRVFDAVQDPLIGRLSDRYHRFSFWYMGMASIILCLAIYGIFNALPIQPVIWFSLCVAIAVSAYSVLSINLNTLGSLWTKNHHDQTRITTLREACGLVGLVIAVSLPGLLRQYVDEQQAYMYFCLVLSAVMMGVWFVFWPWLSQHVTRDSHSERSGHFLKGGIRSVSGATRYFLGVYVLSMLASSIPAVLVIFFTRDLLNAEHLTGLFLLLYFLSGVAAMPLWKATSARLGKYRAWGTAMLLAVASFIGAFFLSAGDVWQYAIICIFSGLALGADLALPPSILADHIHQNETQAQAATHYALLALAAKLSLALASAIVLPLLGKAGFVPAAHNTDSALFFLSVAYALVPCLLKLGAVAMLWRMITPIKEGASHENYQANYYSGGSGHA
jgi:glycoside/pentoside/hexuronide:cation symporter, GPH family